MQDVPLSWLMVLTVYVPCDWLPLSKCQLVGRRRFDAERCAAIAQRKIGNVPTDNSSQQREDNVLALRYDVSPTGTGQPFKLSRIPNSFCLKSGFINLV